MYHTPGFANIEDAEVLESLGAFAGLAATEAFFAISGHVDLSPEAMDFCA